MSVPQKAIQAIGPTQPNGPYNVRIGSDFDSWSPCDVGCLKFELSACLDPRIFTGISKEFHSFVLLTSYTVWNGGKQPAIPEERNRVLHKTREKKHPLRAVVLRKSEASEEKRSILLAIKTHDDRCCYCSEDEKKDNNSS